MDWKEVRIYTTTEGIETVAALLEKHGIEGYVLQDAADFEEFLQATEIYWDYVEQSLVERKRAEETSLTVYLPEDEQGQAQLTALQHDLDALREKDTEGKLGRLCCDLAHTRQEDWEWGWKQYFKPFPVGERFLIKPSWETVNDAQGRQILEIDPASSFGTGTHETTRLCIAALERVVHSGDRVLDWGTGSGILAIAAAMLGGQVEAIIDIDENCLRTAHENAQKNHVTIGRGLCGDALQNPALAEQIGKGYQVIVANIVADVIIGLAPMLFDKLAVGGTLVCSGILCERADEVAHALTAAGFDALTPETAGEWQAFTAHKP